LDLYFPNSKIVKDWDIFYQVVKYLSIALARGKEDEEQCKGCLRIINNSLGSKFQIIPVEPNINSVAELDGGIIAMINKKIYSMMIEIQNSPIKFGELQGKAPL